MSDPLRPQDENLVVPCHGYPVMNELQLPKRVDFGSCPINDVKFQTIDLACKTPINFEFEVTVLEPHPEISIGPLRGIVPALGVAAIEVRYQPTTFRTATAKLQVRLSQFGFDPVTITVTGNCAPGLLKEAALADTQAARLATTQQQVMATTRESFGRAAGQTTGSIDAGSNVIVTDHGAQLGYPGGGGGARNDLVSSHRASRQKLERSQRLSERGGKGHGTIKAKPPNFRPPSPDQTVEGIRFPADLSTHAAIADVMTQEAGKLKIRDLKKAIDSAKAKAEADAEQLAGASLSGAAEESGEGMSRQLKETVFEREVRPAHILRALLPCSLLSSLLSVGAQFRSMEEFERSKEVKWFVCVGDENMTSEQIAAVQSGRARRDAARVAREEAAGRARKRSELTVGRPAVPLGNTPVVGPTWELAEEGQSAIRHFGLERFVDAARVVVIHNRVNFRLAKLRALFDRIGRTMEAVGELVDMWDDEEAMHKVLGDTTGDGEVDATDRVTTRLAVETVQRFAFPAYRESEFADLEPLDQLPTIPFFEELDTFALAVPLEAELQGYRTWQLPVSAFDFPADRTPALRVGAQEESVVRSGCEMPEGAAARAAALAVAPSDLALPVRPKGFRPSPPTAELHKYPETAADFPLRPVRPESLGAAAHLAAAASRVGGRSVVVAENTTRGGAPLLSSAWLPPRGPGGSEVMAGDGGPASTPRLLDGPDPNTLPAALDAAALSEPAAAAEETAAAEPEGEAEPEPEPEDEFLLMVSELAAAATPFLSARAVAGAKVSAAAYAARREAASELPNRVAALQATEPLLPLGVPH